jgi:hypothetical protein
VDRASRPWTIALAVVLLVGTVVAFTYTESLKLERKPVRKVRLDRWLSPVCDCPSQTARIAFELREPERLDISVVDGDGNTVRVLAAGLVRPAGRVVVTWDGRDDAGRVVPDGAYRIRLRLLEERRTIAVPRDLNVDTRAPEVTLVDVSPTALAPGEGLVARYRADEAARPSLLVDGEEVLRRGVRPPGPRRLAWPGLANGLPLAPGDHALAVRVADRAGNVSAPTESVAITVIEG